MGRKKLAAVALAAGVTFAPVRAQEAAPAPEAAVEAPVPTVVTKGVRDPGIAPYADIYDQLTKVRRVADGKAELLLRVVSSQSMQPLPDLEVSLQGATANEKVPVSAEGFVNVPLNERWAAEKAFFVTNKKTGAVRGEGILVPVLPRERLTYGDLSSSIAAGRDAVRELLPWYVRIVASKIREVRICYPDSGREVAVAGGAPRPAVVEHKSPVNKKTVYCAAFDAREVEAAPETVVTPAQGWVGLFG